MTNNLPKTRGDCIDSERPCLHITCRYHLFCESPSRKEQWVLEEMIETCVLDVVDNAPPETEDVEEKRFVPLHEVGHILDVSRERIRQIEDGALKKLKKRYPGWWDQFEDYRDRKLTSKGFI